jgi:L-glyceraldehyde 3-phosphate reductase
VLHNPTVTSAIIGASQVSQIEDCVQALDNLAFSPAQLDAITQILED